MTGICKLKPGDVAPHLVVVGAPERAELLSTYIDNAILVAKNREYVTYTGTYKGIPISIMSHGVGGGGASMAFEEAISAGAKVIIRAGTCGSFQPNLLPGSLVIATGAVRYDGVTNRLVNKAFPAICHYQVVQSLINTVSSTETNHDIGIVLSDGPFYSGVLPTEFELYQKAGVLCVEMELSVLLVISSLRGVKAGGIFNVDNYIFKRLESKEEYNPHTEVVQKGVENMCRLVLDAIINVTP
jgi:uridine phosphorylase